MTTTATAHETIRGWVTGRLRSDLYAGAVEVIVDRDEVTVVGPVPAPEHAGSVSEGERSAAEAGRIREFRERTRLERMEIARELEATSGRKVSWGAVCGQRRELFTTASVPVMTRLRQPERQVLDTLVDAGVARSRSDALAWCVRLVGRNAETWLSELRIAIAKVDEVRRSGPDRA
jgi:hypothetical protein